MDIQIAIMKKKSTTFSVISTENSKTLKYHTFLIKHWFFFYLW